MRDHGICFQIFADFDLLLKELFLIHCFFVFRRGRDESRLGLRNWMKKGWDKSVSYFCPTLVFLKFPKNLTFGRRLFERGWDRSV